MTIAVVTENTAAQNATPDAGELRTGFLDTEIDQDQAAVNLSSETVARIRSNGTSNRRWPIFLPDLSWLPAGATITSATLYLKAIAGGNAGGTFDIVTQRIIPVIDVGTVTWNSPWNTAGALGSGTDFDATPISTVATTGDQNYEAFDVTSYVSGVAAGTFPARGLIQKTTDADFDARSWASSQGANGDRPELVIDYTAPSGPTITSTDPAGPFTVGQTGVKLVGTGFGT